MRAARLLTRNVPNPTICTDPPVCTPLRMERNTASNDRSAAALLNSFPNSFCTTSTNCALFMSSPLLLARNALVTVRIPYPDPRLDWSFCAITGPQRQSNSCLRPNPHPAIQPAKPPGCAIPFGNQSSHCIAAVAAHAREAATESTSNQGNSTWELSESRADNAGQQAVTAEG